MNKEHPEIKFGKTGVLIVNLGTPDSTNWWDIRKYLKEFLSDRRVIEVNPIIWQIILNLFILTFRPSKTAHAYKKIWLKEKNESPLLFYTRSQSEKLRKKIGNDKLIVDFAMRYGNPSIKSRLNLLKEEGCENLIDSLINYNSNGKMDEALKDFFDLIRYLRMTNGGLGPDHYSSYQMMATVKSKGGY